MQQYHELLEDILKNGISKGDRTGIGTLSVFGRHKRFDLTKGFPLLTTKKVSFKNIVVELLFFLRGKTEIDYLHEHNCHIWDQDCERFDPYTKRFLGKIYPHNWRNFGGKLTGGEGVDQIKNLIEGLKIDPDSRRHIVTAWNPVDIEKKHLALCACHTLMQFYTRELNQIQRCDLYTKAKGNFMYDIYTKEELDAANIPTHYLDCKMTQRSGDTLLGIPYNIASYALLTHIIAQVCNMVPGEFIHDLGDVHIYKNHLDAAKEQLQRDPNKYPLPKLEMSDVFHYAVDLYNTGKIDLDTLINGWAPEDFKVKNYQSYPKLENSTELNTGLKK